MNDKKTISTYPNKRIKIETYKEDDTLVTKFYYDARDAYVKELTKETDGTKDVKHFSMDGVLSKQEYFVDGKRHGVETRYLVSKAEKTIKSTKTYFEGKLHGDCFTYNSLGGIIKQEVFVNGKIQPKAEPESQDELQEED
ncbi:hypothetical protein MNB_SM-4-1422 [hydrothermal vent metagenome]|uniref:1-phosphatidylinositol-4-phosphate 5-kinase n=1 Tax=hydrothermal vent metagenome TaxID=652676 RepID=A0A1W1CRP1_9ZZZZ